MEELNLGWTGSGTPLSRLGIPDVAVIGSGPAGATVARELSGSHLRVVVLESGDRERTAPADALNEVVDTGYPRQPDQWLVRNRVVGGSSTTWAGRCTPFDEIDFEERAWVTGSGWPITAQEMEPYLERSAAHLNLVVGSGYSDSRFWSISGRDSPLPNLDPSRVRPCVWQFSRDPQEKYPFEHLRLGRHLHSTLGSNVTLVTGATVTRIQAAADGRRVQGVEVAAPDGSRSTLPARAVVLAAGGLENARLLLVSSNVVPQGLGNQHDLVGRYLMDHLRGPVADFDLETTRQLRRQFGRYNFQGRLFLAGLRLSPDMQRREGLLNAACWLGEDVAYDDPWLAIRRLIRRPEDRVRDALSLSRHAGYLLRGGIDYAFARNGLPRKLSALRLVVMAEQKPDRESRLTLAARTDRFGVPLPSIDWRVHPDEVRTIRRLGEVVIAEFRRLGLPAPVPAPWTLGEGALPAEWMDVAHPTGTTRMAAKADRGVVDSTGKVHGTDNLYVAGSSVFPTSGHGNPTQMIVANSIRLADELKTAPSREAVAAAGSADVLVTGGRGRLGRFVLAELVARGYRVRATASGGEPREAPGVSWRIVDLVSASPVDFDGLVDGVAAVVHLAAEIHDPARMDAVNERATRLLAEAAERRGVAAFCYTSTVSVYGSSKQRVVHEDAPVLTVTHDDPREYLAVRALRTYGRTKLAGELALRRVATTTRYSIVRPTVIVDVSDILAIREWSRSKKMFAAHRHAHHVYVKDVADAVVWVTERAMTDIEHPGRVETYNVGEDEAANATHNAFLRAAFQRTADPRFRTLELPGIADWMHDLVRFRAQSLGNPLWRMRFPSDRLLAAGWRRPFGIDLARRTALASLTDEMDRHR